MVAGANMQVAVVGTVQTSPAAGSPNTTVNQGNQGTIAQRWYVQLTDGTNTVPVIVSPRGNFLSVGEGAVNAGTTLTAATTGTGTVIDFGSASSSVTFQVSGSAGITAGQVQFMGSVDGTTFVPMGTPISSSVASPTNPISIAANTNYLFNYSGVAIRYLRCDVSTAFTGGTVTAKVSAF